MAVTWLECGDVAGPPREGEFLKRLAVVLLLVLTGACLTRQQPTPSKSAVFRVTNAAVITEEGRQVTDLSKIAEVVGEAARLEVVFEPKVSLARMSEVWGKLPEAADAEVRTTSGLDLAKLSAVPIRPRMHPPDPPWLTIEIETSGKAISRLRVGRHEFSSVGDFEKR